MKRVLLFITISLILTGCVAYPVYDNGYGYNYPNYGPYPYGYVGPNVNFFVSGFHSGGHGFHGGGHGHGHGFHRGGHGGGHRGGGRH